MIKPKCLTVCNSRNSNTQITKPRIYDKMKVTVHLYEIMEDTQRVRTLLQQSLTRQDTEIYDDSEEENRISGRKARANRRD